MKQSISMFLACWLILLLGGCASTIPTAEVVCGGLAGQACPAEQYCAFPEGADCGRADATGICNPRPEICTQEYNPVCGCDGETYSNACMAAAAGVSVDYPGDCSGEQQVCGGIGGFLCPDGMACVDDPSDDCDPAQGGMDCMGICR